jgi:glutaminyl-tRNA synthetase
MSEIEVGPNFIKTIIEEDLESGKHQSITTRFPPEPNGYLHIGHAKSICLNFGLARDFKGSCHLRFDDTNPEKEEMEYVHAIKEDVKWLGFDWNEHEYYASDYYEKLYLRAIELIKLNAAYVCELNAEEMREYRGTLKSPGKESPFRNRGIEENLDIFKRMRDGEFEEGKYTLRAKIDMASPNMNMRDPAVYRIKKSHHQRTGDAWPIYPMYDYAHCMSDAIEGITHSLCTLEFEDHRPLYDWFLDVLKTPKHPQQIEFSRLNLEYTVMSKRKLLRLVEEKHVSGWDDPRMPTISGMRRRGYTPNSIRNFASRIGVTKKDSSISIATLEHSVREDLENICPRVFGVIEPLKVTITNFDENLEIDCPFHPKDESFGSRKVPFTKEIFIERSDFLEDPPKKFFRLGPERSVRLKYAFVITCNEVIKNDSGEVVELKCSYNKETFGGKTPEGMKKVKGIINWVSATESVEVETRLYDRLCSVPNPGSDKDDFLEDLNSDSLEVKKSRVERSLKNVDIGSRFQFERQGYFIKDQDAGFNRIITLRDTWAKQR